MRALIFGARVGVACWRFGILAGPASAQENIDAGKTPAQLYSQDCAICHKSPSGMARAGGLFGLENFLREHYTASRETAAAIAALSGRARPQAARACPPRAAA